MGEAHRKFWRLRILFSCMIALLLAYVALGKINPSFVGKIRTVDATFGRVDTRLIGTAFVLRQDQLVEAPTAGRVTLLTSPYRAVAPGDLLAEIDPGGTSVPSAQPIVSDQMTETFYRAERERLQENERDLRARLADAERVMRDAISSGDQTIIREAETRRNEFVVELGYIGNLLNNLDNHWEESQRTRRDLLIAHPTSDLGETTVVTAPWAGTVISTFDGLEERYVPGRPLHLFDEQERVSRVTRIEDGLHVNVGDPILRISQSDDVEMMVGLQSNLVERGRRVTVSFGQALDHFVTATVTEVHSTDEQTVVRLRIDEFNDALFDFRRGEVTITAVGTPGIIVPTSSIIERRGTRGVYIMLGDRPIFREVRVLGGNEKEAVVDGVQGVPVGAPIVVNPERIR